jgi:UDP-2,4-diacetamido-2,4,6-trideoxy-beta-L-altropyranose hydrolase
MTSSSPETERRRSTMHASAGRPASGASTFPGSRVDPIRACTNATTLMTTHRLTARTSSETPALLIVADAGTRIGFGHVGRCLAILEEFGERAAIAVRDEAIAHVLEVAGVSLVAPDAPASIVLIDRRNPTSAADVRSMQALGKRVCLLDDLGDGRSVADLIVDPPTGPGWPPAGGRRLAGFEHALLRRDIRAAANRGLTGVEVLLSMGGSDPEALTPVLAHALRAAGASVLSVLGPAYRGTRPDGDVLGDLSEWPRALTGARLLVARFGHTLLEAAHLGTPVLAVATDARAQVHAQAFTAHGAAEMVSVTGADDAEKVTARALALLEDHVRLAAMAERGRALVDGLGAARVASALRELA